MSTANVTITTAQQVELHCAAVDPEGNLIPGNPSPVWTVNNANVGLSFPEPDSNTVVVIGLAVGWSQVTATVGSLTQTYLIDVVSPAAVSLQITNDPPTPQNDLQKTRGRGLGLGYQ